MSLISIQDRSGHRRPYQTVLLIVGLGFLVGRLERGKALLCIAALMFQSARELSEHTGKRPLIDRRAGHLIAAVVNSVQTAGGSQQLLRVLLHSVLMLSLVLRCRVPILVIEGSEVSFALLIDCLIRSPGLRRIVLLPVPSAFHLLDGFIQDSGVDLVSRDQVGDGRIQ